VGKKHVELLTAEVGGRVLFGGVENQVDQLGHEVGLAVDFDGEIGEAAGEGSRKPMAGFPVVQSASDDYRLVAVEIILNEVLIGLAGKPGNRRLKGSYCS
jgi:hypothetical protein